jgi:hypothetical protein
MVTQLGLGACTGVEEQNCPIRRTETQRGDFGKLRTHTRRWCKPNQIEILASANGCADHPRPPDTRRLSAYAPVRGWKQTQLEQRAGRGLIVCGECSADAIQVVLHPLALRCDGR